MSELSEVEKRAVQAYGFASVLRGFAVGFGFGVLGSFIGGAETTPVAFVLGLLAVGCLVVAKFLTIEFDE